MEVGILETIIVKASQSLPPSSSLYVRDPDGICATRATVNGEPPALDVWLARTHHHPDPQQLSILYLGSVSFSKTAFQGSMGGREGRETKETFLLLFVFLVIVSS